MENFETLPGVLERERGENVDLRSKVKQLDVELSAAVSQKQVRLRYPCIICACANGGVYPALHMLGIRFILSVGLRRFPSAVYFLIFLMTM